MKIRHPPGRSGRLWLIERLTVAERASGILRRKQHALRREEQRLARLLESSGAAWTAAVREAEMWQRRAMIVGARSSLRAVTAAEQPAAVHLVWQTMMGVEFPGEARCDLAPPAPIPGTPSLGSGAVAYRRAISAAVDHAAVAAAAERVHADLGLTQQRLTAVDERWIPALRETLRELELRLDEHEREELARSRPDDGGRHITEDGHG